ncbi:response regulator [Desulfobulbus alkaliphilus]|uniref:response regulator n=1 Tax=Desulfobulbus alkaliphilus TaxID=869814 RepID=UPI001962F876|nr:response regulator [Desulfobulbus alkaliphilus]MBM9537866.1 response regulator [Desulfobulbus alkaliphilus]
MEHTSILVVDDEELIRESLRLDMLDQGYAVDLAANGEEAVARLDRQYNLIITDLIMDGLSGLDVLRLAKERRPEQAVFILTGFGELESAIKALRLGANDYLLKPYNHDELFLCIARCLAGQQLQQKVRLYESLLSICSECKKIRDKEVDPHGDARWISIEQFISKTIGSDFSHGICPECYHSKMTELNDMIRHGRFYSAP